MTELYINDSLIDLKGDESIEVDYSSFDLTKIESRSGARSYTFEIPKTNRNKEALENPEVVNNLSTSVYSKLPARVYVDGVDVLIRFAEIQRAQETYSVRLYGANSGFYELFRNVKLKDLNYCDLNFFWNLSNVANSFLSDNDWIYPVIDYHTDSPNTYCPTTPREINIRFMYPSLRYQAMIQRGVESIGYAYEPCDTKEEMILAYSGDELVRSDNVNYLIGKIGLNTNQQMYYNMFNEAFFDYNEIISQHCNYWFIGETIDGATISGGTQLNFWDTVKIKVHLYWIVNNNSGSSQAVEIRCGKDVVAPEFVFATTLNTGNNILDYTFELTNEADNGNYRSLYFTIRAMSSSTPNFIAQAGSYVEVLEATIVEKLPVTYLSYITPNSLFGETTCIDLFKDLCIQFCLMPVVDEVNKSVSLFPFNDFKNNISKAYDWSGKLDYSEEAEVKYIIDNYAQNNYLKYKEDGEEVAPNGTNGNLQVENKNLELDIDLAEMSSAPTLTVTRMDDLVIPNIGIVTDGVKMLSKVRRVLYQKNKYIGANIVTYKDGTDTYSADTYIKSWFIDEDEQYNLGFGNNLIEENYVALKDVLGRIKIVSVYLRLSAADISQIDFTRPVYLSQYESFFYINSIKGFSYTESKSTLVELVKLNING